MAASIYNTLRWRIVRSRAIARDGGRCSAARFLGGSCSPGPLHVHHLVPISEGGDPYDLENCLTVCSRHHPQIEALRRYVLREDARTPRCPHQHRTADSRRLCEARMARRVGSRVAAQG